MAGPMASIRFIHAPIRNDLKGIKQEISVIASLGAGDMQSVAKRFAFLEEVLGGHEKAEEEAMFPAIDAKVPGASGVYEQAHRDMDALRGQLRTALANSNSERAYELVSEMVTKMDSHLDQEEQELIPLFDQHLSAEEQRALGENMQARQPREQMAVAMPWIFKNQGQEEREGFLRMMQGAMPPPAFQGIKATAQAAVPPKEWEELAVRMPELKA